MNKLAAAISPLFDVGEQGSGGTPKKVRASGHSGAFDRELDELYTTASAAKALRVSVSFLAKARLHGDGPRFVKIGRSVRYRRADLLMYLKARSRASTSE